MMRIKRKRIRNKRRKRKSHQSNSHQLINQREVEIVKLLRNLNQVILRMLKIKDL